MKLRYLPFFAFIVLLTAACGRGEIPLTAVPTRPPTEVAAVPTADTAAATEEAAVSAGPVGDAARGATLYTTTFTTAQGPWACSLCHNVGAERLVGPGMGAFSDRFAGYGLSETPETYLHDSIVNPNLFIVPADAGGAYPPNLMPQNYAEVLTEQDIADLVAYILTLS